MLPFRTCTLTAVGSFKTPGSGFNGKANTRANGKGY